jgi:hypothetical protein
MIGKGKPITERQLDLEGTVCQAETYERLQRFRLEDVELPCALSPETNTKVQCWLLLQGPRIVNNGEYVIIKTKNEYPYEDLGSRSKSGFYLDVLRMEIFDRKCGKLLNTYYGKPIFDGPTVGDLFPGEVVYHPEYIDD